MIPDSGVNRIEEEPNQMGTEDLTGGLKMIVDSGAPLSVVR